MPPAAVSGPGLFAAETPRRPPATFSVELVVTAPPKFAVFAVRLPVKFAS